MKKIDVLLGRVNYHSQTEELRSLYSLYEEFVKSEQFIGLEEVKKNIDKARGMINTERFFKQANLIRNVFASLYKGE
jgi:hypothetical protein